MSIKINDLHTHQTDSVNFKNRESAFCVLSMPNAVSAAICWQMACKRRFAYIAKLSPELLRYSVTSYLIGVLSHGFINAISYVVGVDTLSSDRRTHHHYVHIAVSAPLADPQFYYV